MKHTIADIPNFFTTYSFVLQLTHLTLPHIVPSTYTLAWINCIVGTALIIRSQVIYHIPIWYVLFNHFIHFGMPLSHILLGRTEYDWTVLFTLVVLYVCVVGINRTLCLYDRVYQTHDSSWKTCGEQSHLLLDKN